MNAASLFIESPYYPVRASTFGVCSSLYKPLGRIHQRPWEVRRDSLRQRRRFQVAQSRFLVCCGCGFEIEAWSDGNPYYRDHRGRKRYAYHPDHERLARCIGNDEPHLCLQCGAQIKVDSLKPVSQCRKCKAGPLIALRDLEGRPCPHCSAGKYVLDSERGAIS